jgi:cytochrome c oxidase subunit 1
LVPACRKKSRERLQAERPAPAKPWDGGVGLVWEVPSPAPYHSFTSPPEVK